MWEHGAAALLALDSCSYRLHTIRGTVFSSLIKVDFRFSLLALSSMQMLY